MWGVANNPRLEDKQALCGAVNNPSLNIKQIYIIWGVPLLRLEAAGKIQKKHPGAIETA
jgi:hypothetical protein